MSKVLVGQRNRSSRGSIAGLGEVWLALLGWRSIAGGGATESERGLQLVQEGNLVLLLLMMVVMLMLVLVLLLLEMVLLVVALGRTINGLWAKLCLWHSIFQVHFGGSVLNRHTVLG